MQIRIKSLFTVNFLLILFLQINVFAQFDNPFQLEGGKRNFSAWQSKSPKEAAIAIANRVISQTPFTYKLAMEKPGEKFDAVRVLDFGRTFGLGKEAVAFAISEITATADTSITLEISHNDEVLVFLNGKDVYKSFGPKKFEVAVTEQDLKLTESFDVELKKGSNRLLIKCLTKGKDWLIYLQPKGTGLEPVKTRNLGIGISKIPGVDRTVSDLSNWLICGPFLPESQGITASYGPEKEFKLGQVWEGLTGPVSWSIPKTDPLVNVLNPNPMWGTHYNYNYQTAALAWTMANLGKMTGSPSYNSYAVRYCNFMLDAAPLVDYQYNTLHKYQSVHHPMLNRTSLANAVAPILPFAGLLSENQVLERKDEYKQRIEAGKQFLTKEQPRSPDGNFFCRINPDSCLVTAEDMFMFGPFMVMVALSETDPKQKSKLLHDAANLLFNQQKGLFDLITKLYYDALYYSKPSTYPYVSRSNGMAIFATSLLLQNLPKNHPAYKAILKIFTTHATQLSVVQDSRTGHWHQILNDTSSQTETSGTAFIIASLARGVNAGWLPKAKFEKTVNLGWNAVASQISPEGDVFGICIPMIPNEDLNYYKKRQSVRNASEGVAAVLWAAMEMEKLKAKK